MSSSSSEYGGNGVLPNTIFPKGDEALNAHDKLRLDSLTGQTEDARAPRDLGHWQGNLDFDETKPAFTTKNIEGVEKAMYRENQLRYKESPRSFE